MQLAQSKASVIDDVVVWAKYSYHPFRFSSSWTLLTVLTCCSHTRLGLQYWSCTLSAVAMQWVKNFSLVASSRRRRH